MKVLHRTALHAASLAVCLAALPARAQEAQWTLGVTGGSLGVGPQLALRANSHVGVRLNAGFLSMSRDERIDQIDYDGDLDLNSFGAMLDWYPTGGGLRVSLGGRVNNNEVALVGRPGTSVTVGDTTYSPQQIGTLSGTVTVDEF